MELNINIDGLKEVLYRKTENKANPKIIVNEIINCLVSLDEIIIFPLWSIYCEV